MSDSLIIRFFSKIFSRGSSFLFSLLTIGIVPRILGPEAYGSFNYLNTSLSRLIQFLQLRTNIAFFIKFSKKNEEKKIVGFFTFFLILIALITIFFVVILSQSTLSHYLFPDSARSTIYFVLIFSLLNYFVKSLRSMIDALGLTIKNELAFFLGSFLFTILILITYYLNILDLNIYILISCSSSFFIVIYGLLILKNYGEIKGNDFIINKDERINYQNDFIKYVKPLIAISFLTFFSTIFDRWLLQKFYGSVDQGYFSLAFKLSGYFFVFTASIIPLIQREFAAEVEKGNYNRVKNIYYTYGQSLFFLSTIFGVFIAINSEFIISFIAGEEYLETQKILFLLIFYNLYRTKAQFATSFYYSIDDTKGLRKNAIIVNVFAIPLAFFLIAPSKFFGFGLGSMGLCLKLIIAQQFQLFLMNIRINKIFKNNLLIIYIKDILFIVFCILIALLFQYFLNWYMTGLKLIIFNFVLYSITLVFILYNFSGVVGVDKKIVTNKISQIINKKKSKR